MAHDAPLHKTGGLPLGYSGNPGANDVSHRGDCIGSARPSGGSRIDAARKTKAAKMQQERIAPQARAQRVASREAAEQERRVQ